jgi:hypothetical protein
LEENYRKTIFLQAARHGHHQVERGLDGHNIYVFRKHPNTTHGVTHPHHHESKEILWAERQSLRVWTQLNLPKLLFSGKLQGKGSREPLYKILFTKDNGICILQVGAHTIHQST